MNLLIINGIAMLLAPALATPIADDRSLAESHKVDARRELAKRVQGVHLANCNNNAYSMVVFCANDGSSSCNSFPTTASRCFPAGGGLEIWEGDAASCTFSTDITFSCGANNFGSLDVFKDDQHTMFFDDNRKACNSIYYCLPGSDVINFSLTKRAVAQATGTAGAA
ncbi:hypothetical protein B0T24DRAFT_714607 [Lasiosphaeria ovina]|uniref:Uncharacterized protein n=1 Tax=Lasiosphaeria ovina TaxID=92902 RepID=A0AAE0NJ77_9PEZI|nr:hypothetical protein B0T24DRAFT_714607 [Lasiosphaeria ovina]